MTPSISFHFDFTSPFSYLAWTQLGTLVDEYEAELQWRPVQLGRLFELTGNASPATCDARRRYLLQDLERWASRYDVPFHFSDHFPLSTTQALRIALTTESIDAQESFIGAAFRAMWAEGRDLTDPDVLRALCEQAGLDDEAALSSSESNRAHQQLEQRTAAAARAGVFGVPTFIVGDELFFGQDRLHFVAQALER